MTRMLLLAALVCVGAAFLPARALADIPEPYKWTIPSYIDVVGRGPDGAPDLTRGTFVIIARDQGGNPMGGLPVTVSLAACTDIRIDSQQWAPLTVDCATKSVTGVTAADGTVTFCIVGAATNQGGANGAGAGGACVYGAGSLMATMTATVFDQNGAVTNPGVELTDAMAMMRDWGSGNYYGRSDYDHDGLLGLSDMIVLMRVWGAGSSVAGPIGICP